MTTRGFTVTRARDARFERGLRTYYEYRDLGIKDATDGKIDVHVIRAVPGEPFSSEPHVHRTTFQLIYVLKGWIELEYEEYGVQRFESSDPEANRDHGQPHGARRSDAERKHPRHSRCGRS
jgi:hypothetical protein